MPLLKLKTGTYLNYKLSRGGMEVVDVDPRKPVVVLSVLVPRLPPGSTLC